MKKELNHFNVQEFFEKAGTYNVDKLVDYLDSQKLSEQESTILIKILDNESETGRFTGIISAITTLSSALLFVLSKNLGSLSHYIAVITALITIFFACLMLDKIANTLHNAKYKKALLIYQYENLMSEV